MLIQNQRTMEMFSRFQPLFAEAINSNRIGVCKWIESGSTVDTALPGLSTLTEDKEEWRAIIVRYEDDDCMAAFEYNQRNPFDFLINKDVTDYCGESPIPIVRLAQMLGGVPPLEIKFRPELIREDHKAPRTIYVPVEDKQLEIEHKKIAAKYKFDGRMPAAVLLISVRDKSIQEEGIRQSWTKYKESDSSEFWKRNRFPSVCRFLTFDFKNQGAVQKEADDFRFWYSVMLMATNEWDSGTLQAYRLYSMAIEIDKQAMTDSFQALADRLRDARYSLEKSIKKDLENRICEEVRLPEYRINVTVSPKLPKTDECRVKQSVFGLLSRGSSFDVEKWNKQKREIEELYETSVRTIERAMDQTADKMRAVCCFTEGEVSPLNRYQVEDLERETNDLYQKVVSIQSELPNSSVNTSEDVKQAAQKVKENMLSRVMSKPAFVAIALVALLVAFAAIPAIISIPSINGKHMGVISIVIVCFILFYSTFGKITLLIQKKKLNSLIAAYNQHIKNAFIKLVDRAGRYTAYMSGIASHSRGSSYLNLSNRMKLFSDAEHFSKYKHMKAINILLGRLNLWSKAFRLDLDFTSTRSETRVDIDTSIAPIENKMYSFESGVFHEIAINHSGMVMKSPYCFAKKIEITREELYENE